MWRVTLVFIAAGMSAGGVLHLAQTPASSFEVRLLVALCGAGTVLLVQTFFGRKARSDAFGSAAFATPGEVADLTRNRAAPVAAGSVLLGTQNQKPLVLPPTRARQHGIIVGPSGSGKSFSFFLPNAARLQGTSCVFSDPKSELFRYTSGFHHSLRFAPCEPDASECFNWIPLCQNPRLAEVAARAIVESGKTAHTEQIWLDLEAAFLSALFSHASTLSVPTPLTAYRLFTEQNQKTLLAQFAKSRSSAAREQANIFEQTSERVRGSIVPFVAARLQFLRDPQIARFTSATLIAPRFRSLRQTPTALYWCLHEKDIPRLRPLTSLFYTLLLEELNGETQESGNSTTKALPVLLFLDEFGVVGAIPDFEATIALARGRGMGFWLGVQSLSQLESVYGRSAAQTILTNCSTKMALSGLDVETADYFSRTLGQGTIARKMRSWQRRRFAWFASTTSDTLQEHGRLLLTADEVRRLSEREMLVITGNTKPMLVQKIRYDTPPRTAATRRLGKSQSASVTRKETLPPPSPLPLFPEDL